MIPLSKRSLDELLVIRKTIIEDILPISDPDLLDIKDVKTYIHDRSCHADAIVNDIPMEFNYYDDLGFLFNYKKSKTAFIELMDAIECNVLDAVINPIIEDKTRESDSIK